MTYISGLNFVDISDTFFFCNRTVSQIMKNDSVIEEIMQKDK